jgi:hypothetical protein
MTDDERLALAERAWMENRHDERAYLLAFARALESRVLAERQPSAKDQARRFVSDFTREMGFAMSDHAQEVMLNLFLRNVAHPTPDDASQSANSSSVAESVTCAAPDDALNKLTAEMHRLRGEIEKYQGVCAAAYQFVGAVDGPVRFLDALSNAANGEPASVEDSLALLPAEPSERIAGMEKDAERYRHIRATTRAIRDDNGENRTEVTPEQFDAAIDATIAKEPKCAS